MKHLLSLESLSKSFSKIPVLKEVTMNVSEGELVYLAGENGAGKTTLFQILTGMLSADSGKILWSQDEEITSLSTSQRVNKGIAYLPQKSALIPNLTVGKLLDLARQALGEKLAEESDSVFSYQSLFDVKKYNERFVYQLSRGERKRLELLITLMTEARLYIFDEPVAGLDHSSAELIYRAMLDLHKKGKTLIYCDHSRESMLLEQELTRYTLQDGQLGEG